MNFAEFQLEILSKLFRTTVIACFLQLILDDFSPISIWFGYTISALAVAEIILVFQNFDSLRNEEKLSNHL